MPSKSDKQRRFMGAELSRLRAGKKTKTGMNEGQLKDYMKVKVRRRPHGSGTFTDEEMAAGVRRVGLEAGPTDRPAEERPVPAGPKRSLVPMPPMNGHPTTERRGHFQEGIDNPGLYRRPYEGKKPGESLWPGQKAPAKKPKYY